MIRKLAIALTLVSAGYAGMVQALGLGDAKVNSNLNQPLVAEIDLLSAGGLTDAEILPGLATREEFLRAGIDRVYFLSDIRFEIKAGADGEPKILLTTKKPVREPFLNFLVEVIWPSGRLLREYALLIDPPVYAEDKPVVATPSTVNEQPKATPLVTKQAAPIATKGDNLEVRSSVAPKTGPLAGNETYGKTTSKDTLWDIATNVRPDRSVSPQQVMLAIQDLNPNAFIDNNINKLKAGQILRLPTREQIESRSTYQAINAVIEQNAALRKPKTKTPTSTAAKAKPVASQSPAKQAGDELKLVVPERDSKASDSAGSDPSGTSASGTASSEEINIALEQLDKANLENKDLSEKVVALEDQLETLQRLLTLKNDQLATLQSQMRSAEMDVAEAEANSELAGDIGSTEDLASNESETSVEEQSDNTAQSASGEVVAEVVVAETIVDVKKLDADGNVVEELVEVQEVVEVAPVAEAPAPAVSESAQPASFQEQIVAKLVNNPMYQAIAAGVLVLLLVLLWLVSKSRAKDELEASQEEDDSSAHDNDLHAAEEAAEVDAQLEGQQEEEPSGTALESEAESENEVTADEEQNSDSGEDVIAEADVYIAYGRLDQAVVILEGGIAEDPIRTDYRLKLLEVFKDLGQRESFDRQFNELAAIQNEEALERAAQIRAELQAKLDEQTNMPASSESVDDVEHLLDEDEEQALLKGDDNNFDFDVVEPTELAEEETEAAEVDTEAPGLDAIEEYAEEAVEEVTDSLDFDSEELDVDLDIALNLGDDEADSELEVDPGIDFDSVDLSLDDESEGKDAETELTADNDSVDSAVDLDDLGAIDLDAEGLDSEAEIELELSDLELESTDGDAGLDESEEEALSLDLDEELELPLDEIEQQEAEGAELDTLSLEDADSEDLVIDDADALGDLGELSSDESADLELDTSDELSLATETQTEDSDADLLELGDDDLEITDDTLEEAAQVLGDADDFEPELSDDEDFDFLEGTDEASTKLDLARAYVDMGDVDGAKEILQEVEQEGSAEQQKQAKDLIESLGK